MVIASHASAKDQQFVRRPLVRSFWDCAAHLLHDSRRWASSDRIRDSRASRTYCAFPFPDLGAGNTPPDFRWGVVPPVLGYPLRRGFSVQRAFIWPRLPQLKHTTSALSSSIGAGPCPWPLWPWWSGLAHGWRNPELWACSSKMAMSMASRIVAGGLLNRAVRAGPLRSPFINAGTLTASGKGSRVIDAQIVVISCTYCYRVRRSCRIAKNLPCSSTSLFGGWYMARILSLKVRHEKNAWGSANSVENAHS